MCPGARRDVLVDEVKKYLVQINEPLVPSLLHLTIGSTNSCNEENESE